MLILSSTLENENKYYQELVVDINNKLLNKDKKEKERD